MYCSSTCDYSWILFKLRGVNFCMNSEAVERIILPDNIHALPDSPPYLMGIINLDGRPRNVIGLRKMLGMGSLEEDFENFAQMRKKHIDWVEQLKRCAAGGEKFTLPIDPHACAFGQWYDSYHTDDNLLRFLLLQVESPHNRLHHCAVELEAAQLAGDHQAVKEKLCQAEHICNQELLPLLDHLVAAYRNTNRGVVIMLNGGLPGLFADEVSGLINAGGRDDGTYSSLPGKPDRLIRGVRTFKNRHFIYLEIDPAFLPQSADG